MIEIPLAYIVPEMTSNILGPIGIYYPFLPGKSSGLGV